MISRRQLLISASAALLFSDRLLASSSADKSISWPEFEKQMFGLAQSKSGGLVSQQMMAQQGLQYLKQLDISSAAFNRAEEASYESGNRYWLWQRMMKAGNINGGILNIDDQQLVQLHDHPGATGMVRIISGEVEAWQFDESSRKKVGEEPDIAQLTLVSRRILRPGDTAVLTPAKGNIHALRSVSKECRMLDFFIPPYERSERSWFEPLAENWFAMEKVACRKIPQHAYTEA